MQKCVKSWWPSSDEPQQLFFHVVGYMMFIFSYYSLLAADSNPLFFKRLGYFFTPDCKYVGVPRVVFSIGIAKMYFPELKIFEIVFG